MTEHRKDQVGRVGEEMAAAYLQERGYTVLARNVRFPFGELDIVAREGGDLVFVEVKTRSSNAFGTPAEAVTTRKQKRMARAAEAYCREHNCADTSMRCDVVAITLADTDPAEIDLIQNAIELGMV